MTFSDLFSIAQNKLPEAFDELEDFNSTFLAYLQSLNILNSEEKEKIKRIISEEWQKIDTVYHDVFQKRLDHPNLIIATTGTTSSGKSTLVNLLCGANLVPEAVGEMSAGLVEITHLKENSSHKSILSIEGDHHQNRWKSETIYNLSDKEIQWELTKIMTLYREHKESNHNSSIPIFKISYPIQIAQDLQDYGLNPQLGFVIKILDLPGLKYSEDTSNIDVIKQYSQNALCLVTYDSSETDSKKQDKLLEEVRDQVKSVGGSIERMNFIFNKIDVFLKDQDPQQSVNRFKEFTTKKIKEVLTHKSNAIITQEQSNFINPILLSSKPALFSTLILKAIENGHEEEQNELLKNLTNFYQFLIDEKVEELELPRKIAKWSSDQKTMIANFALEKSDFKNLQKNMKDNFENNLEGIIITPMIYEFRNLVSNFLTILLTNSARFQVANEQALQEQIKKIEATSSAITLQNEEYKVVFKYFNSAEIFNFEILMGNFLNHKRFLIENHKLIHSATENISLMYAWIRTIKTNIDKLLNEILKETKEEDIDLDDHIFNSISRKSKKDFRAAVKSLKKSDYNFSNSGDLSTGDVAYIFKNKDESKLKNLVEQLNTLVSCISKMSEECISATFNLEKSNFAKNLKEYIYALVHLYSLEYQQIMKDTSVKITDHLFVANLNPINSPPEYQLDIKTNFGEILRRQKKKKRSFWDVIWGKPKTTEFFEVNLLYYDDLIAEINDQIMEKNEAYLSEYVRWQDQLVDDLLNQVFSHTETLNQNAIDQLKKMLQTIHLQSESEIQKWNHFSNRVKDWDDILKSVSSKN